MKKETLQVRIEKHLCTKTGSIARKYEEVIELVTNPNRVMRPIYWRGKGDSLHDSHEALEYGLAILGVDYETGNDAPRCGLNGYYVKLTAKGKGQVKDYSRM